jgi:hypothetical protein
MVEEETSEKMKTRRSLKHEEKTQYYKKLSEMVTIDPSKYRSEKEIVELANGAFHNIMKLGKQNRLREALQCYDETKHLHSATRHCFTLSFLIGSCTSAADLPSAIRLFNEMSAWHMTPNEAAYVSLIRCFSDDGNDKAAVEVLGRMSMLGVEIKLRCCQPILECICRSGKVADLRRAFEFVDYMTDINIRIQKEQIITLASSVFKAEGKRSADLTARLEGVLRGCSEYLFGLPRADLLQLACILRKVKGADIEAEGALTDPSYLIQPRAFNQFNQFFTAEEADNLKEPSFNTGSNTGSNNYSNTAASTAASKAKGSASGGVSEGDVDMVAERVNLLEGHLHQDKHRGIDRNSNSNSNSNKGRDKGRDKGKAKDKKDKAHKEVAIDARKPLAASLVNISNSSAACPNCGSVLGRIVLTEDEQSRVREALYNIALSVSPRQLKHLKDFAKWLQTVEEFDYIVDACNIAYARQNHATGNFSFRQIELVVNYLRERNPHWRILVILPTYYLYENTPNNVAKSYYTPNKKSADDVRILAEFKRNSMLYEAPKGSNDDWYWIFATVHEGRRGHAYVVTNDRMRDHRLAFLEPRPFLRWRNAHVALFDLAFGASEEKPSPLVHISEPGE